MSLAKRGWRLRQMAWSLQHSGVARLVLKSSSLTFQQILPGGWGVCHTTPRIHTALFNLPSPPFLLCLPPSSRASDHCALLSYYFILTYVYIHTLTCIVAGHLDLYKPGKIRRTRGCRYVWLLLWKGNQGGLIERGGLYSDSSVKNLIQ